MAETLAGRVALVTGGARGIGRAVAIGLAADGADVGISYRRDPHLAAESVAEIEAAGRRSLAVRADLREPADLDALVASVADRLGPPDILVCNAGVDFRGAPVTDTSYDEVLGPMQINALAAHQLCRLVVPGMRERPRGDVVMISSIATRVRGADYAPYVMSKAALEALADVLAKEEARNRIRVNVVAPGLVRTEMGDSFLELIGADGWGSVESTFPFGRVCEADDVADVVRWLVSARGSYVTGQCIYVDGGGAPEWHGVPDPAPAEQPTAR